MVVRLKAKIACKSTAELNPRGDAGPEAAGTAQL